MNAFLNIKQCLSIDLLPTDINYNFLSITRGQMLRTMLGLIGNITD